MYGFGEEKKTNPGLPAACDTFVFVETLAVAALPSPAAKSDQAVVPAQATAPAPVPLGAESEAETSTPSPATDPSQAAVAVPPTNTKKVKSAPAVPVTRATPAELRAGTVLVSRLREAVTANCGSDGWTHLSAVGLAIRKHPAVVLKAYGYARLMDLMVATNLFELQQNGPATSGPVHARIK